MRGFLNLGMFTVQRKMLASKETNRDIKLVGTLQRRMHQQMLPSMGKQGRGGEGGFIMQCMWANKSRKDFRKGYRIRLSDGRAYGYLPRPVVRRATYLLLVIK
jgi:hypothetical protein